MSKPASLTISSYCPKKLVSALRKAKWNFSELSRRIGVNKGVIHKLVTKGIEPKGERLRVAVFLSKHPRKPHKSKQDKIPPVLLPKEWRWWRTQPKSFKDRIVLQTWLQYAPSEETGVLVAKVTGN